MVKGVRISRGHCVLAAALLLAFAIGPAHAQEATGEEGRMISVRTAYSTHFDAYLVGPSDARLGVLLVHDRWGLNDQVKAWANRLAGLGHRVLAVDLYDGRSVGKPRHGIDVWRAIDPVWTTANLDGGVAFLREAHQDMVVLGWGKAIGPVGELAQRAPNALSGLVLYYDADTMDEARHLPARPAMPVLDITVARSLVHPQQDHARLRGGAEEVWQATSQFLARFAK